MADPNSDFLNPNIETPREPEKKLEEDAELDETMDEPHSALDQLKEPGGLLVEDMPESNELQERRRKTKNRLREMTESEEPAASDDVFDDQEEGGLMDLLREANLSTRHLKFCCSGVVLVALLVGLYFGGKSLWTYWQNRSPDEVVEEDVETPPDETQNYDFLDPSLLSGILVGEETPEEDAATDAGETLGTNETASDTLTQGIVDFAKLYESMSVDINQLLASSSDRRGTLEDYVNELKFLVYTAGQNIETLNTESENLVDQYTVLETEKDEEEQRYFDKLRDLDAYGAVAALQSFVEKGQSIVELRAEYNARQKIISYYEQILDSVDARLKDIELNEEALVKGIQVVQIEDSDLNLIIDESEL